MGRLDHVVLNVAANTVLRAKKRSQFEIVIVREYIRRVPKGFRKDRGLITYEADTQTADDIDPFLKQAFNTEFGSCHNKKLPLGADDTN